MTPTERTIARLPAHLRRYVVSQDYDAYTPRDQAVWRHILGQLRSHLARQGAPASTWRAWRPPASAWSASPAWMR